MPHVNTHIKYQKPGINNFEDIQFWKFSNAQYIQNLGFLGICSMTFRIMKLGMNDLVPNMDTHIKFQKPGFSGFRENCF